MSADIRKKAAEEALSPVRLAGRALAKPIKKELIEKITPTPPGGAPSLQRKILQKALENK